MDPSNWLEDRLASCLAFAIGIMTHAVFKYSNKNNKLAG